MADQITENGSTGTLWKTMNTVGILGTLGAALSISIPALVKANDAQDHDHRHHRDVENDVVYLRSKIYTDSVNFDNYKSQVAYQEATNAKIAALDKENALLKQSQEYGRLFAEQSIANVYQYANSTFMKGSMFLPASSINPLPMDRFNNWVAPVSAEVATPATTTTSNG